jgi:hypothetical protein
MKNASVFWHFSIFCPAPHLFTSQNGGLTTLSGVNGGLALMNCPAGQVLKSAGTNTWNCAGDDDTRPTSECSDNSRLTWDNASGQFGCEEVLIRSEIHMCQGTGFTLGGGQTIDLGLTNSFSTLPVYSFSDAGYNVSGNLSFTLVTSGVGVTGGVVRIKNHGTTAVSCTPTGVQWKLVFVGTQSYSYDRIRIYGP